MSSPEDGHLHIKLSRTAIAESRQKVERRRVAVEMTTTRVMLRYERLSRQREVLALLKQQGYG